MGVLLMDREQILKQVITNLAVVTVSILVALVLRFLGILSLDRSLSHRLYWDFADSSLTAAANSTIPILLVGVLIFGALAFIQQWANLEKGSGLILRSVAHSIFFALMLLVRLGLPEDATFPRYTLVLAWLLSILGIGLLHFTRSLGPVSRGQILYNRANQFLIDMLVIVGAFVIAYMVRFDGLPMVPYSGQLLVVAPYVSLVYLLSNCSWGVYAFIWHFIALREAIVIGQAVGSAALFILIIRILVLERYPVLQIPFGILVIQPMLVICGLLGVRILRRLQYHYQSRSKSVKIKQTTEKKRVLIVGAGEAGRMLLSELIQRSDFHVIGFVDDDVRKLKKVIGGIRVLGTTQQITVLLKEKEIDEVILCMPTAPGIVIREAVAHCQAMDVPTSTIPSLSEIILGKVSIGHLRHVEVEDLLGRETVVFPRDDKQLISCFQRCRIMVTGSGGSIGSELVRQLSHYGPEALILLDKDENGLHEIGIEIAEMYDGKLVELVADIQDNQRLRRIFMEHRPQIIFHAAAYKHVPMMEKNPSQAILNNVIGSQNIIELAVEFDLERFVLISSDKAVNPANIMGASKRLCEIMVQNTAQQQSSTRFCAVRFGNVLGSRGSVVPLFRKWLTEGIDLKVTHPEVERFFMTIPEAVQLVIQAGSLGREGEIFVLDMGEPVKILDLAHQMIELSGLKEGRDVNIQFTGLRPGEKLFEELIHEDVEESSPTSYKRLSVLKSSSVGQKNADRVIELLKKAAQDDDVFAIQRILESMGIGYRQRGLKKETCSN